MKKAERNLSHYRIWQAMAELRDIRDRLDALAVPPEQVERNAKQGQREQHQPAVQDPLRKTA